MKITTYKQDGSIKSEEIVELVIPDYLKKFDDDYPILDLTEDEYKLVCSEEDSFARTILMDRLKFMLQYDYELYTKDVKYQIMELCNSDMIDYTPFIADFFGISLSLLRKLNFQLSEWDNLNWDKVYRQMVSPNKEWEEQVISIIVSTVHELYDWLVRTKEINDRHKKPYLSDDTYKELCEAIEILKFLVEISFAYDGKRLYAHRVTTNLIKAQFNIAKLKRSKLYHVISGMDRLFTAFVHSIIPPKTDTYDICLQNDFGNGDTFELTHQEIHSIDKKENMECMNSVKECLERIDTDYQTNKKDDWEGKTNSFYNDFKYRHPEYNGDWSMCEKDFRSFLLNKAPVSSYNPQECYEKLVANQITSEHPIGFSSKLIADLLLLLLNKKNSRTSQMGLYKTLFQFNYIRDKVGGYPCPQNIYDSPIQKALDYVEPLFDNTTFVLTYKRPFVRNLIRKILTSERLQYLEMEKPYGFKGGFNLTLVYNILGYLLTTEQHIIQGDGKNIDKYLGHRYSETHNTKFSERKHYINDYNDSKYYFNQNKDVIDSIIQEHKSINKSH